jgi:hypothetical protein
MVSLIGGYSSPPVAPARPTHEDVFKKFDSESKGYLTKEDLQSAIVSISDRGAQLSKTDAAAKADEAFTQMDTNKDGRVTSAEFKVAADKAPPPAGPLPGGPKGGRGGGGPGGAGGGNSSNYDAADANKDGVVTQLEQAAYNAKHLAKSTAASKSTVADALKAYQS